MTLSQVHRTRRRMSDEKEDEGSHELNLVPYLDIVTNIVMFLLVTVSSSSALARIDIDAPTICCRDDLPSRITGPIAVHVARSGITVAAEGFVEREPDLAALGRTLVALKARAGSMDRAVVSADPGIPYQTVIQALDATRGDAAHPLFPRVVLGTGVQ